MEDTIRIRYRSLMTGAEGLARRDGRVLELDTRSEAEAYCLEHSTVNVRYWIDEE